MLFATIAGNVGKDADLRHAGGSQVLTFNVASSKKVKGEDKTTWVRCNLWGKRGESLAQYITKGSQVTVAGELEMVEFVKDGQKRQSLEMRVSDIKLQGGRGGGDSRGGQHSSATQGGGYDDADYGEDPNGDGDRIPF
jgi:single-strand DNA-binding protein